MSSPPRPRLVIALASLGSALGCSSFPLLQRPEAPAVPAAAEEALPTREVALPLGIASDDDAVVRVVADRVNCSGTLIAEDLVLTAHHCVSARDRYGEVLARDVAPKELQVELGGDYLPWGQVGVRHVVTPPCGWSAGAGDIAVLVLERKLTGAPTIAPRLDREPVLGESLEPVGFGRCATSGEGIRRHQRRGGAVTSLHGTRFRMMASICPGDSGGPMLSRNTSEVVGVISAAVMDGNERTPGRAELTRLDAWREVFSHARQIADGVVPAELPPLGACPAPR